MSYEVLAREAISLSLSEQINLMALLANSIQSKNQISKNITKDFRDTYPEGFFDLFGSLSDIDFEEPEEIIRRNTYWTK